MEQRSQPLSIELPNQFRRESVFLVITVMLFAATVLLGWQFNIEALKRPFTHLPATNPLSAVCFLTSGVMLLFNNVAERSLKQKLFFYGLALFPLITGLLVVGDLIVTGGGHVDTIVMREKILHDKAGIIFNGMGPYTSINFILTGIALILTTYGTTTSRKAVNYIMLGIIIGTLFTIMGYLYRVREFYDNIPYKPMAIQTAFVFIVLSISVLLKNTRYAFMAIVTHHGIGGVIARFFIPTSVLIPILVGYLRLRMEGISSISVELGANLLITGTILLFFVLILYVANVINKKDERRQEAEDKLEEINNQLEQKIIQRTGQLYAKEKRFTKLIENSFDVIALYDENMNIIYLSPSFERVSGFSVQERMEKSGWYFAHPDDLEYSKAFISKVLKEPGTPVPFQTRLLHAEGHYVWVEGVITNFLQDENIRAVVSNYRDITERKLHEREFEEYNDRISNILERIKEGFYACDRNWTIGYWNRAAEEMFGVKRENAIGKNLWEFFPGSTELKSYAELTRVMNERVPSSYEDFYANTWFDISVYPTPDGVFIFFRDITETKRQENLYMLEKEVLQFYNSKKHSIEESITLLLNGIQKIHTGMLCSVLRVKDGRLYNWSSPHLPKEYNDAIDGIAIGEGVGSCGTAVYRRQDVIVTDMNTDPLWKDFVALTSKLGLRACWSHLIMDEDENVLATFAIYYKTVRTPTPAEKLTIERARIILNSIIENQIADEQILKLNAELEERVTLRTAQLQELNKELEAFTYTVSHDLRAPLRSIHGYANILKEDYSTRLDEHGKRSLDTIMSNGLRMGQLIDDLLNFARLGKTGISNHRVDMDQLVHEVIEELTVTENNASIEWHLRPLQIARCDRNLIKQVWTNLLSNALKYSSRKSHIIIEIGMQETSDMLTYYVKDNGAGFDMNYYNKLFGVFQRLHGHDEFKGTGVGLAIVQRIIKRHGGLVWAEAMVDKGATFYFSLPKIMD